MGRLFWKIFFGFWLTLLVSGFAVGLAVQWYTQERLAQTPVVAAGPRAEDDVAAIAAVLRLGGEDAVRKLIADSPGPRWAPVLVVGENGRDVSGRPVSPSALNDARARLGDAARAPGVRRVTLVNGHRYLIFRALLFPDRDPHFHHSYPPFARVVLALIASLLFSAGLAWYLVRPVRYLRQATRRLADGDLQARVAGAIGSRRDEIADLGRDFDRMAERLGALVGAQKRLLADVSHELRSPLARLEVAVALAHQQPEKTESALARIQRETGRLDELVGQLLTLSRLEAGVSEASQDYLDLRELLQELVENADFEAAARGCKVTLDADGEVVLNARPELLYRALENVLRNAVRHTAHGTTVETRVTREDGRVRVDICDRGPGVPEEQLKEVFVPFVRVGGNSASQGYGLGLAIARRAIELHGGTIEARLRAGGGLCVEIRLPVQPPEH